LNYSWARKLWRDRCCIWSSWDDNN